MAMSLDVQAVRSRFPALGLRVDGQPVVYLDNPAGTQVPQRVIDRAIEYWRSTNANRGGVFTTSRRSDAVLDEARATAAAFVNAEGPEEVIFGPNMTTLTFAFSRAFARECKPGDEIVVTRLEHDANVAPWLALEDQGLRIRFADIRTPDCTLDLEDLASQISGRTRLVAMTHASNVVGTIPDVSVVGRLAHQAGAWFWVDAVHYAPHGAIDARAIDCDFLVCSAYKFYGPHIALLYGKRDLLRRLRPFQVRPAGDALPERWESGTQNHEGIAGLLGAFEYLIELGGIAATSRSSLEAAFTQIKRYETLLVGQLVEGLHQIRGVTIYGITDRARFGERAPTVSLGWPPYHPEALARWLAKRQIFTWHGNHYAPVLIERLGLLERGGTLRVGGALQHPGRG